MSVRRARSGDARSVRVLAEGFGAAGDAPAKGLFDLEYARILTDDSWLLVVAEDPVTTSIAGWDSSLITSATFPSTRASPSTPVRHQGDARGIRVNIAAAQCD